MPAALLLTALTIGALSFPSAAATLYIDDVGDARPGSGTAADPWRDLQSAIDAAADGDTLLLAEGTYEAEPARFAEELCGNCEQHRTLVHASRGFSIIGKSLTILGSGAETTTLVTNAGYGVYFENSAWSTLTGVEVTGGVRDADGMATDAGVVVRSSRVILHDNWISNNDDMHEDVVVGIGGVMGREGAELHIANNRIENNGWDGVALYRGAIALVSDNEITGGRGAGIGVTWDAVAVVVRNRISGYWKGIGAFGSSRVVARNNEVFDNLGWGLVATGTSSMEATNNVITRNGNCGVALWSDEAKLTLVNNIVTENGWRDEWVCARVGFWMNGSTDNLDARHNDVWGNVEGDYRDLEALSGADGNISAAPLFADSLDFSLETGSPCTDSGDPTVSDPDGSPSDMGSHGGPAAGTPPDHPLENP